MTKLDGEVRYVKTKWRSSICQNEMEKFAYQTGSDQTGSGQHGLGKQVRGELPKISFLDYQYIIRFLDSNRLFKVLFNII